MIAFAILAVLVVTASLLVVLSKSPVISALWLALAFAGVAGVFVVLGAEFLAAVQLIVYAGAILVFFLFVIMLLNLSQLPPGDPRPLQRIVGYYLGVVVLIVLGFAIRMSADRLGTPAVATPAQVTGVAPPGNTEALAGLLYTDYLFPFEIASVLLTAAVVGAVVLARTREDQA